MPRKNAVQVIENEQTELIKLIDEVRSKIKENTRKLIELNPKLTNLDPYTVKLLLSERRMTKKEG